MIAFVGVPELLLVLGIILLLFGASRLPALARSLGKSTREFKQGMNEGEREADQTEAKPQP
ncbi:MAG TPA: twin-arginine translocase TatA/TatE family subunit [Actinomycetota bacterium]|jgi:sec-independent protein translocase protein TatA|nr:twin-arginine translocase TatA/TatE family subunit [Actinomycetota bacterium]